MPEWLVLLLMSLGAWCGGAFLLGLLIAPVLRKRDELWQELTAFWAQLRSVET